MHPSSGPFLYPLDKRMDLSKVSDKLASGLYLTTFELAADVRQIWSDSFSSNQNNSQIYTMTVTMSQYFEKMFREFEAREQRANQAALKSQLAHVTHGLISMQHHPHPHPHPHQQALRPPVVAPPLRPPPMQHFHSDLPPQPPALPPQRKPESTMSVNSKKKKSSYKPLSERDARKLEEDLGKLTKEQRHEVVELLKDTVSLPLNGALVFDITKLPARKQRELKQKVQNWVEPGPGSGALVGLQRPAPSAPIIVQSSADDHKETMQQKTLKILEKLKRKKERKQKSASVKSGSVANVSVHDNNKARRMFADSSDS